MIMADALIFVPTLPGLSTVTVPMAGKWDQMDSTVKVGSISNRKKIFTKKIVYWQQTLALDKCTYWTQF